MEYEGFQLEELKTLPAAPGRYKLTLYTWNPLSEEKLDALQEQITSKGIHLTDIYTVLEKPPARTVIKFEVPKGYGVLPFWVLLTLAIGVVGIAGFLGWRVGDVIGKIGEKIIPLSVIAAVVYIISQGLVSKKGVG